MNLRNHTAVLTERSGSQTGTSISVFNLTVYLEGKLVLDQVSFCTSPGCMMGILGPNGAGKSTLFSVLAGLLSADTGEVRILDREPSQIRGRLAYVPQQEQLNWRVPVSVMETVLQGRIRHQKPFRFTPRSDLAAAEEALHQVGMWERRDSLIRELSVGQRQRVFLARALAQGADILLLDETFSGVDVASKEALMKVLWDLRDQGRTIILSTHVIEQVEHYCDQCLCLNRRVLDYGQTADVLTPSTLHDLFGPYGAISSHLDCD